MAFWMCFASASGQSAIPDTIYIYETVIVYDTVIIRDTVRIKKPVDIYAFDTKDAGSKIFSSDTATFYKNNIIYEKDVKQKDLKLSMTDLNLKLASYLSAAVLSLQTLTGVQAQEAEQEPEKDLPAQEEKVDLPLMPVQMSIVYPMTTMGERTVDYRFSVSFNLFSGMVGAVNGVEYGTIFNYVKHDTKGVQFAGIGNRSQEVNGVQYAGIINFSGDVTGIQFAGISNMAKDVKGIQFCGISNFANNSDGIQFAGIANTTFGCSKKMQFAGIANVTGKNEGAQFAGIANVTEKSEGAQFAGIGNVSKEVTGVSVGGIFNRTGTLRGVQVGGIVNVIDTIEHGVSIALINIIKKGFYREWGLNFADYQNVGLSYKMGMRKFYTVFSVGACFTEDNMWIYGIGIGNRTPLGNRFDFQPEIMAYNYLPIDFKDIRNTQAIHLKFGFLYKINDRLGISLAPGIYYSSTEIGKDNKYYRVSPIKPLFDFETKEKQYSEGLIPEMQHSFGVGFSVGLVFSSGAALN